MNLRFIAKGVQPNLTHVHLEGNGHGFNETYSQAGAGCMDPPAVMRRPPQDRSGPVKERSGEPTRSAPRSLRSGLFSIGRGAVFASPHDPTKSDHDLRCLWQLFPLNARIARTAREQHPAGKHPGQQPRPFRPAARHPPATQPPALPRDLTLSH